MDLRGPVREEGLMALINEHNRKWRTVATMALTTLLITIDFNGLAVASPTIGKDLDTSTTGLQWTVNAYLLAFAALTVAAGCVADIFGRRRYCSSARSFSWWHPPPTG
jgi:MFS family permease